MPIIFPSLKTYEIDYKLLQSDLMKHTKKHLFHLEQNRINFLEQWLHYLKQADTMLIEKIQTNFELESKYVKFYYENEIFQQPHHYEEQTIYTHFNVSILNDHVPQNPLEIAVPIDANEFTKWNSPFHWTPTLSKPLFNEMKSSPVMAVPVLEGYSNYLIVDGNHRLTEWVKSKNKIPTLLFGIDFLIQSTAFCSDFDKLHYIFRYDLTRLVNLTFENKLTDSELLSQSLLYNLDYLFKEIFS